ncbi:GFA family protein [Sphingomonas crusticola]|uniref:GFA family protein n=1 Tax=Sphingomonas crusticola TaxID=1697973 RepID=UPI000E234023|nr:GFA family protein [Sphingomonas crusticola]
MIEGGCLCGQVRYRVADKAVAQTLCHCISCRRATGGVSVAWAVFAEEDFALLQGEVREYSSSPGIFWGSCATCGSLVTYRRDSRPGHRDVTTATLDDPEAFPPTVEIWTGERIGWEMLNPDLPHKLRSSLNE